jgi:hypothetical protein
MNACSTKKWSGMVIVDIRIGRYLKTKIRENNGKRPKDNDCIYKKFRQAIPQQSNEKPAQV